MKVSKSLIFGNLKFKYVGIYPPKLGLIVSRHYGNAVSRNLFKRRCRVQFQTLVKNGFTNTLIIIPNKQNKMKLGLHMTKIKPGSLTYEIYSNNIIIHERHRHRYEINPKYISIIKKNGLTISGIGSEPQIIDIVEDSSKSFYIGCQYHPEFLSTLKWSAPLFNTFVSCSLSASISAIS